MNEKEVITEKQSKKMLLESRKVFKSSIESHTILLKTENPTSKYIEILSTLITQGKVYLRDKNEPDDVRACIGGEPIKIGQGEIESQVYMLDIMMINMYIFFHKAYIKK